VGRQVLTPVDLEREYGLTGGNLYHGEHAPDQLLVRPILSCTDYATPIKGMYLCSSGTRPGGGLNGLAGLNAANRVLA